MHDKSMNGKTILHVACSYGNLELVRHIIGIHPELLTMRDNTGQSFFIDSGFSGSVDLVKYLTSRECDVHEKDNSGRTVLHHACNKGKLELVQYLVENYPDMLYISDKTGQSPFLLTGFSGSVELVKYLISKGCDMYDKTISGRTVLHHACQEGKIELVQYLVENNPDMLTISDKTGQSPFLLTGFSGSVELVKYLISKGCDVYEKDNKEETVLHNACKKGKLVLVQYIVDNCPDMLSISNETGQSPFLQAGFCGSVELIKYLISRGCDVYETDIKEETVLHIACKKGELELVQDLVENYPDMLTIIDKTGQSPFLDAGFSGSVELVKYLISKGCDVYDKDSDGWTLLHYACIKGKLKLVQYLFDTFPDIVTIKEKTGKSPFLLTGFSGSVELVKYFVSRGCDVHDKDNEGDTVLHIACNNSKLELVQYLVDGDPDMLAIRDETGKSPFLLTGFSGSVEIVKYLISRGCDAYDKDNDGDTVLHIACSRGKLELVQYLVENYPDMLYISDKTGQSPFLLTGFSGSVELVKYLISKGCDVYDKTISGRTVLYHACQEGKIELVQCLVENDPDMLTISDKTGQSPFLLTGFSGSVELVKYLISKGCDVYEKDNKEETVLHHACQEGKLELVQYLVDDYPDMLTMRDKEGQSPFLLTGFSGSVELVKYLVSRECDSYDRDSDGCTVLHIACSIGKLEFVQYFVETYPDMLNIRDKTGQSPFLQAGFSGSVELVKYLVSRGCDVFDKDNDGWIILHYACNKGKLELVQYLVDIYPEMLTIRDKTGRTPFLISGFSGSVELVKYLISRGYDVYDKDNDGWTVLHVACQQGCLEIVHYLVETFPDLLMLRNKRRQTPLKLAVKLSSSSDVIEYLQLYTNPSQERKNRCKLQ